MRLSVGLSAYLNNFSQPLAADVGLHGFMKRLYGKLIPFYRLRLGGECVASNAGLTLLGPEIPVVRAGAAIERIELTYAADSVNGEAFTDWVCRKQLPFFTELLDDFIQVSPSDLPELLSDFDGKQDFDAIMLDSVPAPEKEHNQVVALLNEAENEQRVRNNLLTAGELQQALICNVNILDLAAKAAIHALGGVLVIEGELQLPLSRALPNRTDLAEQFSQLQQQMLREGAERQINELNEQVDNWLQQIQVACEQHESEAHQLYDLSQEVAPVAFLKLKQSLQNGATVSAFKLANNSGVDVIINGLKSIGAELVSRSQHEQDEGHVVLVVKKESASAEDLNSVH